MSYHLSHPNRADAAPTPPGEAATLLAVAPPPHPTQAQIDASARKYFLFGYPISHSASPAFQNLLLQSLAPINAFPGSSSQTYYPTYSLKDTKSVDEAHLFDLVRNDPLFAGAGVTMPLKVAVTAVLGPTGVIDELSEAGKATQSVNTIISCPSTGGKRKMVGTNTDYLGIAHAVLRRVAELNDAPGGVTAYLDSAKQGGKYVFPRSAESGKPFSAFIIGSGGTCRSAVYAVARMGLSPIYLLNRDAQETQAVVDHFGSTLDLRPLRSVEAFEAEAKERRCGRVGHIVCAVGAIPAFAPVSHDENMVYELASRFFSEPYTALSLTTRAPPQEGPRAGEVAFQLPKQRVFLDMCYKPRFTPLLQLAEENGWAGVGGVEAMVEQGLAQARMWAATAKAFEEGKETFDPIEWATKAGDQGPIGLEAEERARDLVRRMLDIK